MPLRDYVPKREATFPDLSRKEPAHLGKLIAVAPRVRIRSVAQVFCRVASLKQLLRARMLLSEMYPSEAPQLSHELMYALAMTDDRREQPIAATSCIRGYLRIPGEFDRQHVRDLRPVAGRLARAHAIVTVTWLTLPMPQRVSRPPVHRR